MKPTMLSRARASYLFDHILDGFSSSHRGIEQLKEKGLINDQQYTELLEKNTRRLIDRIAEFKILQRLVCITFACLFTWLQVSGQDMEMRRARRVRVRQRTEHRHDRNE